MEFEGFELDLAYLEWVAVCSRFTWVALEESRYVNMYVVRMEIILAPCVAATLLHEAIKLTDVQKIKKGARREKSKRTRTVLEKRCEAALLFSQWWIAAGCTQMYFQLRCIRTWAGDESGCALLNCYPIWGSRKVTILLTCKWMHFCQFRAM